MIRRLAELWSRGMVVRRRLPPAFGRAPIFVSPDSQLKYWRLDAGGFDADLLALADHFITSDAVVWDIGANCGVFTLAAGIRASAGRVLAVEPDIWLAGLVQRSARLNAAVTGTIEVLAAALAERAGVERLLIAGRGRAANALERLQGRGSAETARHAVVVPVVTLDMLLERGPAPAFVKIDVEGAELQVLQGGTRLLAGVRPVLHVEVGSEAERDVFALLTRNQYIVYDGLGGAMGREPLGACPWNTLAVPCEKQSGMPADVECRE